MVIPRFLGRFTVLRKKILLEVTLWNSRVCLNVSNKNASGLFLGTSLRHRSGILWHCCVHTTITVAHVMQPRGADCVPVAE